MRKAGGPFRRQGTIGAAVAAALTLAACASAPSLAIVDLGPAKPHAARPLRGQIRVGQPVATADLDSERILVRESDLSLATLPGVKWPQGLPSLFGARLVQSFQNAGLARYMAGGGAVADYELDLDIRSFELDAQKSEVHVEVVAKIVAAASGRVAAVDIFSARVPVSATDGPTVVAALDQASASVMTRIVAFVARSI